MNLVALVAASVLIPQKPADLTSLPIGTNAHVYETWKQVAQKSASANFVGATKLAKLLPTRTLSYAIDLKPVPAANRRQIKEAIEFAAARWEMRLGDGFKVQPATAGTPPDLKFTFNTVLAKRAGTAIPAGSAWFGATDPALRTNEFVVGLKREFPARPTTSPEYVNEALYAFGRWFGLGDAIFGATAMSRADTLMTAVNEPTGLEVVRVREISTFATEIRRSVLAKKLVPFKSPQIQLEKRSLDFGVAFQGVEKSEQLMVTNLGDAPLRLTATGDCSCIFGYTVAKLEPGQSSVIRGRYETADLDGDVEHNIVIGTNDPNQPEIRIPAKIQVNPRAAIIFPNAPYVLLDSVKLQLEAYLVGQPEDGLKVEKIGFTGIDATATYEPFSGNIIDHRRPKTPIKVDGYKLKISFDSAKELPIYGRMISNLFIKTNLPNFQVVKSNIWVQKGIVMSPERVYLGSPNGPVTLFFRVSRPGNPVKITKIECKSKYVTAKIEKTDELGDVYLSVRYDGLAPEHSIRTELVLTTNDEKFRTLRIPVNSAQ